MQELRSLILQVGIVFVDVMITFPTPCVHIQTCEGLKMFDKLNSNRYSQSITGANEKREPGGSPVLCGVVQTPYFPNAHRIPKHARKTMIAKIINRRSDLRRQVYLTCLILLAESLQPVTLPKRGPPF